jgi:hypothetical protein
MQVVDLLPQHLLGNNLLGVKALLPDLVAAPGLAGLLIIAQLIEHPGLLVLLQLDQEALGAVALEIPEGRGQVGGGGHQVEMVVQDDVGVNLEVLVLAVKLEGVDEQVEIGLAGEERQPVDHGAGEEMGDACFSNGITAAHGAGGLKVAKLELRRIIPFPSWSLGTRFIIILPILNVGERELLSYQFLFQDLQVLS